MNLIDSNSGEKLLGIIEKVSKSELAKLKNDDKLIFDWTLESDNQVFKIRCVKNKETLGLISLIDYPKEFRIHINLIESSKKFRGKHKPILNIPGCLIGFACKLAFKLGYEGFVSLVPKTQLIDYYNKVNNMQN